MSRIALSAMHAELNKESRAGAVVRARASHRCGSMWAKFVVERGLVSKETVCCWFFLWSERFFPVYSSFSLSSKTSTPKFQFDPECSHA